MKYAPAVGIGLAGILLLLYGLFGITMTVHAASCYLGGQKYGIETHWGPISGCTVEFLGTQVRVGP